MEGYCVIGEDLIFAVWLITVVLDLPPHFHFLHPNDTPSSTTLLPRHKIFDYIIIKPYQPSILRQAILVNPFASTNIKMDSKFMDNSVGESKIDNLIKFNPTFEDAIDDNDVPYSSSTDILMTPVSSTPGPPVDVKAEESTTPKAAPAIPARDSGSRRGGHDHNSRVHPDAWGSSRAERVITSAPTAPTQAAAPQPPPGHPGYVYPPATIPMRLPFLSHVGLPGDAVINNLDQLVGYVAQLVHMVEDHRSIINSLTTENQSLHQSLLDTLNKLLDASDPTHTSKNTDNLEHMVPGALSATFPHRPATATPYKNEDERQRRKQHNRGTFGREWDFLNPEFVEPAVTSTPQPSTHHHAVIGRMSNSTEAQIMNVFVMGTGLPGLSLHEVRGHGSGSDWLGGSSDAPRVVVPHHYPRRSPVEFELTMFSPQVALPSTHLMPAAPRYRGHPFLGDFMGFSFPFHR
ncbi:hypothetical protein BDZ45DRAFT_801215 [Acephala macrosclerotiorum]|nr:hypothetical protein BDZ45DRAFT_801215 [Acephala macrosclerotiorum]